MIVLIILLILLVILAFKSIKVVRQSEVYIIERLGKFHKVADAGLTIIIPFEFLNLFILKKCISIEVLEDALSNIINNSFTFFPDIKFILSELNENEIQHLFYLLQKFNNLTPYQIALLLYYFPEYTLLIKSNLGY